MVKDGRATTPYGDIITDLVRSIMAAQADALEFIFTAKKSEEPPDGLLSRHFVWLTHEYKLGTNRHLFDGIDGSFPLRTKHLRSRRSLPAEVRTLLAMRQPINAHALAAPAAVETGKERKKAARDNTESLYIVPQDPTRISRLIKQSCAIAARIYESDKTPNDERSPQELIDEDRHLRIFSPLNVALLFLTSPSMPSSYAYSILTIRNWLFEVCEICPDQLTDAPEAFHFSVRNLEDAYSRIWTSLRPRHWSSGEDPIPSSGRVPLDGFLRHFLASKGMLCLRFSDLSVALKYLRAGVILADSRDIEFSRSNNLERLPEVSELVNELWGLPVPIRGADTILRGGLRFSSRRGLVVALHGGPGAGKTTLALALSAYLSPFEIKTLFVTAEESGEDLKARTEALIPDELRRASFFPKSLDKWFVIQSYEHHPGVMTSLTDAFRVLGQDLKATDRIVEGDFQIPKTCRSIVVLDGVHDVLASERSNTSLTDVRSGLQSLRTFITECRNLRALVILTTGEEWQEDAAFDYMVDVSLRLSHDSVDQYGRKPERRLTLRKARHQICAVGTHGIQVGGSKGVRFSPQISYELDRRAIWRTRLPQEDVYKSIMANVLTLNDFYALDWRSEGRSTRKLEFETVEHGVSIFRGSSVFLNGAGSGGKAALGLKIALAPAKFRRTGVIEPTAERILVISFLYPQEYYSNIMRKLIVLRRHEYGVPVNALRPTLKVIQLYPGYYQPDYLFNRIELELTSESMRGTPYTCILLDGIHNVYYQFPEIERYTLFWPQLYAALRVRALTIISTYTTIESQTRDMRTARRSADENIEPLRHPLQQKADFHFDLFALGEDESQALQNLIGPNPLDGRIENLSDVLALRTVSAMNQPIPAEDLFWSRDKLVFFEPILGLRSNGGSRRQAALPFDQ